MRDETKEKLDVLTNELEVDRNSVALVTALITFVEELDDEVTRFQESIRVRDEIERLRRQADAMMADLVNDPDDTNSERELRAMSLRHAAKALEALQKTHGLA